MERQAVKGSLKDRQKGLEESMQTERQAGKRQVNGQTGSQEEGMQTDRQTGLEGIGIGRLTEWERWAGNSGQGWEVWVGIIILYRREGLGRVGGEHMGRDGKFT